MFDDLSGVASLTRIEEEIRRFWRRREVPDSLQVARRHGSPFFLSQQPLMAVGESATDQVRLLATADLLARFHAMRGQAVHRHAGWVCHGLPVEVAVERSLGSSITEYDLAQFNAVCRQAAIEGVEQGEALTERLGVWSASSHVFCSLQPRDVGVVWAALRRLWEAGQLRYEHRIAPVCPRCATPLSSAEASKDAVATERRVVWVRLPWVGEPNTYFLAWTPTPWTLVGMVALAVHPEAEYALVELPSDNGLPQSRMVLAETALRSALPGQYRLVRRLSGQALRDARYYAPFTFVPAGEGTGRVLLSELVPLDQGTGLWPVTPGFDSLSLALAQERRLPVPELLDDWGGLDDAVMPWRGLSPSDAEPLLLNDLDERGLLFREKASEQLQALCPYCEMPLLPLARWVWLAGTEDDPWIVGRDRAWGVPLPVWSCGQCGDQVCLAGLDDLARRTGQEVDQIDPHRPAVDWLTFACATCGGTMRRVAPVIDAAFESAVLSWSSAPTPGPANVAVALGDRHLGWPGDLAEVAALLQHALAWEQALTVPEDEANGNWDLERITPADALRWAAYTGTTPGRAERDFLRPLWQLSLSLLAPPNDEAADDPLPAERGGGTMGGAAGELLDRWLAARLHQTITSVTQALSVQDVRGAARDLTVLVGELCDWYVPQRPGCGDEVLEPVSRLIAPFVPHLAEAIHRRLAGRTIESVHLAAWPLPDPAAKDRVLLAQMARVWHLAMLGQRARAEAGIGPERLLRRAYASLLAGGPDERAELGSFAELLAGVLGVREVHLTTGQLAQVEWGLALDPSRKVERDVAPAQISAALAGLETEHSARMASELRAGLSVGLEVAGRAITLLPDEVLISALAQPGWAAAADADYLVVMDVG